ncbi:hypothetical protein B0H34DRAFT_488137 [Crassisporium funariophilum]|nr:hypothetical protein B0H34DRAFT_488137 [Crassisporium funariophilum]
MRAIMDRHGQVYNNIHKYDDHTNPTTTFYLPASFNTFGSQRSPERSPFGKRLRSTVLGETTAFEFPTAGQSTQQPPTATASFLSKRHFIDIARLVPGPRRFVIDLLPANLNEERGLQGLKQVTPVLSRPFLQTAGKHESLRAWLAMLRCRNLRLCEYNSFFRGGKDAMHRQL